MSCDAFGSTKNEMPSQRNSSVMDDVDDDLITKVDEIMSKISSSFYRRVRKNCQELINNAEQEAITIVTEAAQRTEEMITEAEKRVKVMKRELSDLEEEKKRRTEAMLNELEEEKKRIANTHIFGHMVKLDVGGKIFTTATATLKRYPSTMLGAMFSGRHALTPDEDGAYCIDRDGRHFHEILNFLRGTTASTKEQIEARLSPIALKELKVEADFYGMKDLMFSKACVRITGAAGPHAHKINGMYEATTELSEKMPIYAKVGDACMLLECRPRQWHVKDPEQKGKNSAWAYCTVPAKCLPQECPAGKWYECSAGTWVAQPAITIKAVERK